MNHTFLLVSSTIIAIIMASLMIFLRTKIAKKPTSVKKIILPPIMMSTGALMFLFPYFRVSAIHILESFIVGIIFSVFLIKSTKFETRQNNIYIIPSRWFILILFGLLAIRITIKLIIGKTISFGETSGLFFLLAFGMILTWRIAMLIKYLKLKEQINRKRSLES